MWDKDQIDWFWESFGLIELIGNELYIMFCGHFRVIADPMVQSHCQKE